MRARAPFAAFSATLLLLAISGSDCGREPARKPATNAHRAGSATAPSGDSQDSSQVQLAAEELTGVDAQDAPDTPRALPRSGTVGGWIKSRPVKVFSRNDFSGALTDDRLREAIKLSNAQRILTCEYQSGPMKAEVLYVEARPLDALGLFTILTADPKPILRADGSMHGHGRNPSVLTAWQGNVYVQVTFAGAPENAPTARCEQLIDRIVFTLPSADPPALLRIIPRDRRDRCRVWFTHTADALRLTDLEALKTLPADEVNPLLGLGNDTTLSVAAIDIVPGEPHLIWLAEYPNAEAARAAHARCEKVIKAAGTPLARTTAVEPPRARFLAGTWTRQQEALQPLLPLLTAALPEPPTTRPATATAPDK